MGSRKVGGRVRVSSYWRPSPHLSRHVSEYPRASRTRRNGEVVGEARTADGEGDSGVVVHLGEAAGDKG